MAYANGHLPPSQLAMIPGGHLRRDAASAWNAMCLEIRARGLTAPRPAGHDSSYRPFDRQQYFYRLYKAGKGNTAAVPGTSNHGWGVAVDVRLRDYAVMAQFAAKYGFNHVEGASVGEGWHYSNPSGADARFPRVGFMCLMSTERRAVVDLVILREQRSKSPRRAIAKARVFARRQEIRKAARKSGWKLADRQQRDAALSLVLNPKGSR
jgi:hypothetical protein